MPPTLAVKIPNGLDDRGAELLLRQPSSLLLIRIGFVTPISGFEGGAGVARALRQYEGWAADVFHRNPACLMKYMPHYVEVR